MYVSCQLSCTNNRSNIINLDIFYLSNVTKEESLALKAPKKADQIFLKNISSYIILKIQRPEGKQCRSS